MPALWRGVTRRYGLAVCLVAVATLMRIALRGVLGDQYPFFLFFVAIVLTARYAGYGPSALAVVLSWITVDALFGIAPENPHFFHSRSQVAFAFFSIGVAVTMLGGALQAEHRRAMKVSDDLRRTFALQQTERDWLRITLASIADAVITTDPEGRVSYLNPVASRLTGWTAPDAVGSPLAVVFRTVLSASLKPDDLPISRVVKGGEILLSDEEVMLISRRGQQIPVEHNAAPIRDSEGNVKGVVIVFRDITERHHADQALKESDERFRQLADNINDVFWVREVPGFRTVYVSPAYAALWGRPCKSLYDRPMSFLEAIHPEDRACVETSYQRLIMGEAMAVEYRLLREDGTLRWIWDRGFPICDAQGRVERVAGLAEEITERKHVEQVLREGEEWFRALADATPVLIWSSGTDAQVDYFNKQWLDFTGRALEQEHGEGWLQGLHPDDRRQCMETYKSAFDARTPFTTEYRLRRNDGQYRWVLDNGVPRFGPDGLFSGFTGSCIDITDRRRSEIRLRQSEERFRRIVETALEGIWVLDPLGKTNFANARMGEILGVSLDELEGRSIFDFVDSEERPRLAEWLQEHPNGKAGAHDFRFHRTDGRMLWAIVSASPYTDDRGRLVGVLVMLTDITARKQAEDQIREADRRKEEFLAVLSHELRNPLAPIQSSIDLLERGRAMGIDPDHELAVIKRQVRSLRRLVDDLLDVSRISQGRIELRKETIDLVTVAAHAVETVRPLHLEQNQQLHVDVSREPILLEADPTRLEQILANLLVNAAKYTPRGGQIWLVVENLGAEVAVRVRDSGIGIEPELLPRVFDMFLRGERRIGLSHEGGGIGLSLAKNLVELHGGSISAHSPGRDLGSEFVVTLPILKDAPEPTRTRAPRVSHSLAAVPSRRVLIVDDNVQAADSLGRLMAVVLGQEVRVVHSGTSALQEAAEFTPDLVLLDLEMTGMDGYEVAVRLRELPGTSDTRLVAVTGWSHEEDRRRTRATGFAMHLVKPVTLGDLKSMLAELDAQLAT